MINKIREREAQIIKFLQNRKGIPVREIVKVLGETHRPTPAITVKRTMARLVDLGYAHRQGAGRSVVYSLSPHYAMLCPMDADVYFAKGPDERSAQERFNFTIFKIRGPFFTKDEMARLMALNRDYRKNIKGSPERWLRDEYDRLVIELSWKSSQIEGNTYTLLETEALLKYKEEAAGHAHEEAIMILNHKVALGFIRGESRDYKKLTVRKIEDVHTLLLFELNVPQGIRKRGVSITGTRYRPLDNIYQIRETMEALCERVNREKNPFAKAMLASLFIAYLQPFEDGNKRTSRIAGNAVLMAHGLCPLSYRNASETDYKKAVILFYEQNNLSLFKQLFIQQFEFAVKNYFRLKNDMI